MPKPKRVRRSLPHALLYLGMLGLGIVLGSMAILFMVNRGAVSSQQQQVTQPVVTNPSPTANTTELDSLKANNEYFKGVIEKLLTATTTKDGRLLLTRNDMSFIFGGYNGIPAPSAESWNTAPPSKWVSYQNKIFGLSMQLPYNPAWGNKRFALTSYDEKVENEQFSLSFGAVGYLTEMGSTEGRLDWPTEYYLSTVPHETFEQIKAGNPVAEITLSKIGQNEVVTITANSDFDQTTSTLLEIIGKKYNYYVGENSRYISNKDLTNEIIAKMKVE